MSVWLEDAIYHEKLLRSPGGSDHMVDRANDGYLL